jgi:hypothetical protein
MRVCDSADFDGANDFMARGASLDGIVDSKLGIFSAWVRLDGGDGANITMLAINDGATLDFRIERRSTNVFAVIAENAAGTNVVVIETSATYTASATWLHVLMSWDVSLGGLGNLYINDVSDRATSVFDDDTLDYTKTNCFVGAHDATTRRFNGCLADLYFAPGQYLDFALVANRRKFISAGGRPVHLGTTGALPTGTAPSVYFHLDDGEAVANFATNRGTGGNFTITGTLDTGSTSPSD